MLYDYNGAKITVGSGSQISYEYHRDVETGAFYTCVRIPQMRDDGQKQYPFVVWPKYEIDPDHGTESALQMNKREKYLLAINGNGIKEPYGDGVLLSGPPGGLVIVNGTVLNEDRDAYAQYPYYKPLTIDANGNLGYIRGDTVSGAEAVQRGVISAVGGSYPFIYNYENIEEYETDMDERMNSDYANNNAQRQTLCQYENGDYLIITVEGRGYQGGGSMTFKQTRDLCRKYGVKFAYSLDGGGSTETVVGQRSLNPTYDNYPNGRVMSTFIVFNGTDQFR